MRRDIYNMFIVYKPDFQYKWNKIISAGFEAFSGELSRLAEDFGMMQTVAGKNVFWTNSSGEKEAMFAFIIDPTDLDRIISTYLIIKSMGIPVTYAVIEQREDGKGQYDIFRLSELSYLEHANRAYADSTSCD